MKYKEYKLANDLWWEEGYDQIDIAELIGCATSAVSRNVNNLRKTQEEYLAPKLKLLNKNITPKRNEPKQGKTLRSKRQSLPSTKLTWKNVSNMRDYYFSGKKSQSQLAKMYGINQSTVSRIISGKKWKVNI